MSNLLKQSLSGNIHKIREFELEKVSYINVFSFFFYSIQADVYLAKLFIE